MQPKYQFLDFSHRGSPALKKSETKSGHKYTDISLYFKCFSLSAPDRQHLFCHHGYALECDPAVRIERFERFAHAVDDNVSLQLEIAGQSIYIEPLVCVATAAVLAYRRSLERDSPQRAWVERLWLADLRRRSLGTLQRQLSDFRAQVRTHAPGVDLFEARKGSLRFAGVQVRFRPS